MTIWHEETLKLFKNAPNTMAEFGDNWLEGVGAITLIDFITPRPFDFEEFCELHIDMQYGVFEDYAWTKHNLWIRLVPMVTNGNYTYCFEIYDHSDIKEDRGFHSFHEMKKGKWTEVTEARRAAVKKIFEIIEKN